MAASASTRTVDRRTTTLALLISHLLKVGSLERELKQGQYSAGRDRRKIPRDSRAPGGARPAVCGILWTARGCSSASPPWTRPRSGAASASWRRLWHRSLSPARQVAGLETVAEDRIQRRGRELHPGQGGGARGERGGEAGGDSRERAGGGEAGAVQAPEIDRAGDAAVHRHRDVARGGALVEQDHEKLSIRRT